MIRNNNLGSEIKVGHVVLKNRIVMPAMGTGLATVNGEVSEQLLKYYEKRAQGGAAAIIVEIACVDSPVGRASLTQLRIDSPEYIAGLKELSEVIKAYGAKAFIQLHHAGRQTTPAVTKGKQPVAPSPIACRFMRAEPLELDCEGIKHIRKKFVTAALYAKKSGFDGVELHAAHGYLLSEFLSPYSNHRKDEYGGTTENRARIVAEIIGDIKRLAPELLVSVRFNVADFVPGGIEIDEGIKIARLLEAAGADMLNVSCGIYESGQTSIETGSFEEAWRMNMVSRVKEQVNIPVLGGGVIRNPETAEKLIKNGYTDLIWVGRGMLADPYWAYKAINGKSDKIRPCISCNTCINQINNGMHIRCAVNPLTAREYLLDKKIDLAGIKALVVGGGPAGMQAALALDRAESNVVLIEASSELGGKLNIADKPPHKEKIGYIRDYLVRQLADSEVEVRLETVFSQSLLEEIKPDVLVIATGAISFVPEIPGIETSHIESLEAVLAGKVKISGQKVVVIGGGSSGCELAEYLADSNEVIIVEKERQLARELENMTRLELLHRLKVNQVQSMKGWGLESISGNTVQIQNLKNNEIREINAVDKIIFACGYKSDKPVKDEYLSGIKRCYIIGDVKKPRGIMEALYEGEMLIHDLQVLIDEKLLE